MSDEITFLPHLRRGLARALNEIDPLAGPLPRDVELTAWVEIGGRRVERAVRLRGPDAVTGLDAGLVVRSEPRPDSADVEPNRFPLVELAAPDLPWLLTPAAPTRRDRLRPWLVLVAVREQEGVSVAARGGGLPLLRIEPPAVPADELPDLADSWAWAHVQSLVPFDEVAAAVTASSPDVVARLVCPRRLLPHSGYVACLVPAFDAGVARGLGETPAAAAELEPAWDLATLGEAVELPVYHHWRFSTGAEGDFESLCRRLEPDGEGAEMGLHAMDVTDPGIVTPAAGTVLLDMEGALLTLEARSRPWPDEHREAFQGELVPLLDAGIARAGVTPPQPGEPYDPETQDPIVAPPTHGAWPAGVEAVPERGWVRTLNAHPVRRAAAGLGARVVRANQEELVAAAWEQAGDLRATVTALNRGRLAAELGRSWSARAGALADGDLLHLTARLHPVLPGGEESVASVLARSAVPAGIASPAHLRATRPGTPLARDWSARSARSGARLAAEHVETTLAATAAGADPALAPALEFAVFGVPDGAQVSDPTLVATAWTRTAEPALMQDAENVVANRLGRAGSAVSRTGVEAARLASEPSRGPAGELRDPAGETPRGLAGGVAAAPLDVSDVAATVRERLDPLGAVRASVVARVPALDAVLAEGSLPTSVPIGPVFDDALYWDLLALGAEWLVPGVGALGANRVRLLAVNPSFVGAFLIGANHELARELLWRGYPVDVRATAFHRFWEYLDPARGDIVDLHTWDLQKTIRENMDADQETMTAVVVRGDLVRRYPTAHWFLQQAALDGDGAWAPVDGSEVEVSFLGSLDAETAVYGFDRTPDDVRGDRANGVGGYFVAVEEEAGAPRLGLDVEEPAHFAAVPGSWDELSWGHLVSSQEELDALTHARATGVRVDGLELDGTTWGRNSAHLARATWQRPFRMLIHADGLI